jgi:HPt (histidine-containing phosphotransfer) domain-containing protein
MEAVRIIREEIGTEYAKNIPIIAFTANAITGNEEMFLSKGFQAFIPKPIDIARLDIVIRQWVRDEEFEKTLKNQQIIVGGEVVFDSRTGYDRRSGRGDRRKGYDRRLFANGVTGVDINKGLERFGGDWETYLNILQSFITNTRLILETVKEVNGETLSDYAINVHGIKSSCRGICAEAAGNQAETLEKAAKAGDLNFVTANNPAFIEAVSELIAEIDGEFAKSIEKKDKPKKDKPYMEALSKLVAACEGFKAAEIDVIMEEIEAFDYEADDGLVSWLRGNVNQMNFMEIVEKLSSFEKENGGKL